MDVVYNTNHNNVAIACIINGSLYHIYLILSITKPSGDYPEGYLHVRMNLTRTQEGVLEEKTSRSLCYPTTHPHACRGYRIIHIYFTKLLLNMYDSESSSLWGDVY